MVTWCASARTCRRTRAELKCVFDVGGLPLEACGSAGFLDKCDLDRALDSKMTEPRCPSVRACGPCASEKQQNDAFD